ncbi:hypothetical protein D3C80_1128960 [compost metagenome]
MCEYAIRPLPDGQVDAHQHTTQQQREKGEFNMHGKQIATEVGGRKKHVFHASGYQVAAVGPEPCGEPARIGLAKRFLYRKRVWFWFSLRILEQLANCRTDIAATRNRRQQIEPMEHPAPGECFYQPKAESRTAHAATGKRQTPRPSGKRCPNLLGQRLTSIRIVFGYRRGHSGPIRVS